MLSLLLFFVFAQANATDELLVNITCPPMANIECDESIDPSALGFAVTDSGGSSCEVSITYSDISTQGTAFCPQYQYFITRTWVATSDCEGTISCDQLIYVMDNTAPSIIAPDNTTMECDENPDPMANPALGVATTGGDNCATNDDVAISFMDASDQMFNGCDAFNFTITRTWIAQDICGNSSTAIQLITVEDTTPPLITCPSNINVSCNENTDPGALGIATATDNCDPFIQATFVDLISGSTVGCAQSTITRTWTAEDDCGNTSTCVQIISISDTSAPTLICPPNSVAVLTCNESLPAAATSAADLIAMGGLVNDNCSALEDLAVYSTISTNSGNFCPGNGYTVVRTYTVIDECGNASTCDQTFVYADSNTGPVITFVAPNCTKYCESLIDPQPTDIEYTTDCNLGATVTISGPVVTGVPNCSNATYYYTYTVTDDCGRSASVERIMFVQNEGPEVSCPAFNLILNCGDPNNDAYIQTHLDLATATSSCEMDVTISNNYSPLTNLFCATPNVITISAVDACGRSANCETTITILDDTAPVITAVPPSICDETECNDDSDYWFNHWIEYMENGLVAEDACGDVTWTTIPAVPVLNEICDANGSATTIVVWVATDDCGNSTTVSEDFVVNNEFSASFNNVPADQTISCEDTPVFGPAPTVVHACQTTVTSEDTTDDSNPCSITVTRTWTATDACGGLTTSAAQTITRVDDSAPVISGGSDMTAECDGDGNEDELQNWLSVNAGATAADLCNGEIWTNDFDDSNWVNTPDCSGGVLAYIDVVFTATDNCGNANSTTFRFNIADTTAPNFTFVPAGYSVECVEDAVFETATASDICASVSITSSDANSGTDCSGSVTRTWTATDACGNTTTASASITYSDTQVPVASNVPADMTISCEGTPVFGADPSWSDNCDDNLTISSSDSTTLGSCANEYVITRTWLAEDACGNTATAAQSITVEDNTAPVFTFVSGDGLVDCIDFVMFQDATAVDNCGAVTITSSDSNTGNDCAGAITRTWIATDACGNTVSASATITYIDDVSPIFTFVPVNAFVECADDVIFAEAVAADLCSAVSLTSNDVMTGDNCVGSVIRTWTATDECGNSATAATTIEYADFQAPIVSDVPASVTISCGENLDFGPAPTFTDNCTDVVTVTFVDIETPGDCSTGGFVYTMERIWTGLDDCGFSATANQTITVIDTGAPVFTYVPAVVDLDCDDDLTPEAPQASDDCGAVTVEITSEEVSGELCDNGYAHHYTWTATDVCGNTATVVTTVWVDPDTEGPVFTYIPAVADLDCDDDLTPESPQASDNCGGVTVEMTNEDISGDLCDNGYAIHYTWTATDDCGNTATAETSIWIDPDNEAPVFTFVPAGDYGDCDNFPPVFGEPVVEDACGSVTVSFIDEAIGNPNGCDDGENFDYRRVWTATDACGNTATAKQTFWILVEAPPAAANLMGFIRTETNDAIESVEVMLDGSVGISDLYLTEDDGMYAFGNLALDHNYSVTPSLNEAPLNGVSSFDMILIAKHLVGIQDLDSPYKMIAADINNSGSITTLDLVELRKLILYVDTEFQNNNSWRFVDANFVFPNVANPFASVFPDLVSINGLLEDAQHDFVGVKIGDVNNSAISNNLLGGDGRNFEGALVFDLKDQILEAGESYEVSFRSTEFLEVMGYQYTLKFDQSALAFESIVPGALGDMSEQNFGLSLLDEGVLTTSWTPNQAVSMLEGVDLFSIRFTAKTAGRLSDLIGVSSSYTKAEAYVRKSGGAIDLNEVNLRFESEDVLNDHFELYQNQPNPFHNKTTIGFNLPEASTAVLTIYDVNGSTIQEISGSYEAGYNEEIIDLAKEGNSGIYYYRLVTSKRHLTKKMILIRL